MENDTQFSDAYSREAVKQGGAALARAAEMFGVTPGALRAAVEEEDALQPPRPGPVLVCLSDVQPQPIRWLWPGRIALGKLTLIVGDPGLGKSFLTLDIASRVSTGLGWPDAPDSFEPGGIVLLSAEDDLGDTIRPRLDAAGADVSRIKFIETIIHVDPKSGGAVKIPFSLSNIPDLETAVEQTPDCRLVVVDPISAYLSKIDSHSNAEVRGLLAPLSELAGRRGVAVVAVSHLNKSGAGPAIYRAMGSLAFIAAARAGWLVSKDKDDPTGRRRLFLPLKNNLGNDQNGLAFRLDPVGAVACVAWEAEPVTVKADDALAEPKDKPGPDADERDRAVEWLKAALADGPRPAREVEEEAKEAEGISKRTLERARKETGVEAYREKIPGPWWWRLQDRHLNEPTPIPNYLGGLGGVANSAEKQGVLEVVNPKAAKTAKLFESGEQPPPDSASATNQPPDPLTARIKRNQQAEETKRIHDVLNSTSADWGEL